MPSTKAGKNATAIKLATNFSKYEHTLSLWPLFTRSTTVFKFTCETDGEINDSGASTTLTTRAKYPTISSVK